MRFTSSGADRVQVGMAFFGAVCMMCFLMLPMVPRHGIGENSMYMMEGHGEQWLLLGVALGAAFLAHRQLWKWTLGAGVVLLAGAAIVVWSAAEPDSSKFWAGSMIYGSPSTLHLTALGIGVILLLAAPAWALLEGASPRFPDRSGLASTPSYTAFSFDPRSRDPLAAQGFCSKCGAENSLTSAVCQKCRAALGWAGTRAQIIALAARPDPLAPQGFCSMCGTANPFASSLCHKCRAPLAWVKPHAQTTSSASRPVQRTKPRTSASSSWFESIDWGFWGVGLLSVVAWPLGVILFFAYSRNDDEKGTAAIIGAGLGLMLLLARILSAMVKVGGTGA